MMVFTKILSPFSLSLECRVAKRYAGQHSANLSVAVTSRTFPTVEHTSQSQETYSKSTFTTIEENC